MIVSVWQRDSGQLYDANGVEILYAVWADTETGEVVALVKDATGYVWTDDKRDVKRERKTHPAPLRFVRRAHA